MANHNVDFSLKDISPSIGAKSATSDRGITASTDLVEITRFVFVTIVRARQFPVHYGPNNCGPYVVVKIGRFKGATLCRRSNSDPEWNQVFACEKGQIEIQETILEIEMKDTCPSFDEYIGRISFSISDIPTRFPTDSALAPQWYGLEDQKGQRCKGELMLSSWIGTQADEAFPEAWHLDVASMGICNIENTRSQIYLMPRIWCLRLNLIQALDLVLEDGTENSHIFVRATLGNMTFTSKLVNNNNGNPKWDEDLLIAVAEPFDQQLFLSVEQLIGTWYQAWRIKGVCCINCVEKMIPV